MVFLVLDYETEGEKKKLLIFQQYSEFCIFLLCPHLLIFPKKTHSLSIFLQELFQILYKCYSSLISLWNGVINPAHSIIQEPLLLTHRSIIIISVIILHPISYASQYLANFRDCSCALNCL